MQIKKPVNAGFFMTLKHPDKYHVLQQENIMSKHLHHYLEKQKEKYELASTRSGKYTGNKKIEDLPYDPFKSVLRDQDNEPKREYTQVGDKIQGRFKQWHPNGNLHIDCFYADSEIYGQYKRYHKDGTLEFDRVYNHSKKIIDDTSKLSDQDKKELKEQYPLIKFLEDDSNE